MACCKDNGEAPRQKPDLIITQATSLLTSYAYKVTARIANIGGSGVNQPFHMSSSTSFQDCSRRQVSYGQMVNDPPSTIPPGGAIDVNFTVIIDDTVSTLFIVVNADSRYNSKIPAANVHELNYDNNYFYLRIK